MTDENNGNGEGENSNGSFTRRTMLAGTGTAMLGSVASAQGQGQGQGQDQEDEDEDMDRFQSGTVRRLPRAYMIRQGAAREQLLEADLLDEFDTEDRMTSAVNRFTKCLPHDENGEVDMEAYETLVDAIIGDASFDDVPLSEEADRVLENPSALNSWNMMGSDTHDRPMPPNPAFASAEAAVEMVELYWMSLARDVPFQNFANNSTIQAAASELDSLKDEHDIDLPIPSEPEILFRGAFPGVQEGPHISQFLYKNIQRGALPQEQTFPVDVPGERNQYMTDFDEWLSIQNGAAPERLQETTGPEGTQYLVTPRDLLSYVHTNVPFQADLGAALIMLKEGVPLQVEPSPTESQFVDYGPVDVLTAVTGAVKAVINWTWFQKWGLHRRLRPEAFGGRVHVHKDDDREPEYPIHDALLESEALRRVETRYGTSLLPQAYPEGSPTHPAYPAGHGTIAGAGAAVLKTYFDHNHVLENPVRPTEDGQDLVEIDAELTVMGEVNKLAANLARGRDMAGIHYYTDGVEGIRRGELFTLRWIQDRMRTQAIDKPVRMVTVDGEEVEISRENGIVFNPDEMDGDGMGGDGMGGDGMGGDGMGGDGMGGDGMS